jgi:hypothetical protein
MRLSRIIGLALMTMLLASMVGVSSASAVVPTFQSCNKGAAGTKYKDNQCTEASATGEFGWEEVGSTEAGNQRGSLTLEDTKVPIAGTVKVSCSREGEGAFVGPNKFSRVNSFVNIKCTAGEHCEKIEAETKVLNTPWQGELENSSENTEKERNVITSVNGTGVGWSVTCKVLGVSKTDECTVANSAKGYARASNSFASNGTARVWLILLDFVRTAPKATCSVGGAGSGVVVGTVALWTILSGRGLLVRFA